MSERMIRQGWPLWAVGPAGWIVEPVIGWTVSPMGVVVILPSGARDRGEDLATWAFVGSREEADETAAARRRTLKEPEHG